jgi:hypothetical protein
MGSDAECQKVTQSTSQCDAERQPVSRPASLVEIEDAALQFARVTRRTFGEGVRLIYWSDGERSQGDPTRLWRGDKNCHKVTKIVTK